MTLLECGAVVASPPAGAGGQLFRLAANIQFGCTTTVLDVTQTVCNPDDEPTTSLTATGALKQPFYNGATMAYKLTYNDYAMDYYMMIGADSDGVMGWNLLGEELGIASNTDITIDGSEFISTGESAGIANGYGTLKVIQTFSGQSAAPGATITVIREYNIPEEDSYTCIMTVRVRVEGAPVRNVRLWMGTKDDWIGTTDSPNKLIGDFDEEGVFQPLETSFNDGVGTGRTIKAMTAAEGVFFTSAAGKGVLNSYGEFYDDIVLKDPNTCETSRLNDDSAYGIFLHMGDIQPGEESVDFAAYAAGPLNMLDDVGTSLAKFLAAAR
jgi:hypothetical protein